MVFVINNIQPQSGEHMRGGGLGARTLQPHRLPTMSEWEKTPNLDCISSPGSTITKLMVNRSRYMMTRSPAEMVCERTMGKKLPPGLTSFGDDGLEEGDVGAAAIQSAAVCRRRVLREHDTINRRICWI
jgi:hypothetical protein